MHDVGHNKKSVEIVRAIVELAKNFHLQIVGEGIESEQEMGLLSGMGCDFGQGYCLSRPMPPDKAEEYVRDVIKKYG